MIEELFKKIGGYICDNCTTINAVCFPYCLECGAKQGDIFRQEFADLRKRRLTLRNYHRLITGSVLEKDGHVITVIKKKAGVTTFEDQFYKRYVCKYINVYDYTWKPKGKLTRIK